MTIQDIRPNPQDTSNFYLANIYQTLADPNRSNVSISLPSSPPTFSPPNYAVWVNSLWFLSLVISLTCALLATLLQQWARRYLRVTQPRYSPHKRARIRAFFSEGVEKFLLPWAVEALPTLLHVSLFLFFAGLVVFLCNIKLTIFSLVLSWVGVCSALYGCITVLPIFLHDSPYNTPLTSLVWLIVIGISYITFWVLEWFTWSVYIHPQAYGRFRGLTNSYHKMLLQGMPRTAEETALNSPSEIDAGVFRWTFDCLDEDHELERFFAGLPGFRSSKVAGDPLPGLTEEGKRRICEALIGLLDRTFSSDLLPESVKNRRAIICAKALDPAEFTDAYRLILNRIVSNNQYKGLKTTEFGRIVRGWGDSGNQSTALVVQAIVTGIIATAQRRDDSWYHLASSELGVPESVLRDYAAHGDNLSFSILIHITRQKFNLFWEWPWLLDEFFIILEAASKFNVHDTSPALQHQFCALWNQIILDNNELIEWHILRRIGNIHIALHQGSDTAPTQFSTSTSDVNTFLTSYPLCNVLGHHPDSTPHIHEVTAFTTIARAVLHDNIALVPASLANTADAPSLSMPAPLPVDENITYVPPLDNHTAVPLSFFPAHPMTVEDHHIPATSPDPAAANATTRGGIDTSARTMPHPMPEPSLAPPLASTFPPSAIALQHNAVLRSSLDVPSSPPIPVPENRFPTDPSLSSDPPVTGSDHVRSLPESHSSMLAAAPLGTPQPTSVPDLGATAEDGGSTKVILHEDKDAFSSPLVNHANTTATPDLPP